MNDPRNRAMDEAHKVAYLAREYSEQTISELSRLFQTNKIDFNVAAWMAEELGYIEVDQTTKKISFPKDPEAWVFGENVEYLKWALLYMLKNIAADEADINEGELQVEWMAGEPIVDITIAVKELLKGGLIKEYTLTNTVVVKKATKRKAAEISEQPYIFYTLPENLGKEWGRKQFPNEKLLKD